MPANESARAGVAAPAAESQAIVRAGTCSTPSPPCGEQGDVYSGDEDVDMEAVEDAASGLGELEFDLSEDRL